MKQWKKLVILAVIGLMLFGGLIFTMPNVAWNSGTTAFVPPTFHPNVAWNSGIAFTPPTFHPNVAWNSGIAFVFPTVHPSVAWNS